MYWQLSRMTVKGRVHARPFVFLEIELKMAVAMASSDRIVFYILHCDNI